MLSARRGAPVAQWSPALATLIDEVLAALSQAIPDRIPAGSREDVGGTKIYPPTGSPTALVLPAPLLGRLGGAALPRRRLRHEVAEPRRLEGPARRGDRGDRPDPHRGRDAEAGLRRRGPVPRRPGHDAHLPRAAGRHRRLLDAPRDLPAVGPVRRRAGHGPTCSTSTSPAARRSASRRWRTCRCPPARSCAWRRRAAAAGATRSTATPPASRSTCAAATSPRRPPRPLRRGPRRGRRARRGRHGGAARAAAGRGVTRRVVDSGAALSGSAYEHRRAEALAGQAELLRGEGLGG